MTQADYEQAKSLAFVLLKKYSLPTLEQVEKAVAKALTVADDEAAVDAAMLVKDIQSQLNILIPDSTELTDSWGHEPWLSEKRASISWHFWRRYVTYMERDRGMPQPVMDSLDRLTDSVLEKMEDPSRLGSWDRRGMVVGQVQSGKTANYTGLICKAVDAGYKLIIVLAGVHNSLRSQTQMRLDEGFLGFDTKRDRAFTDNNPQIGAGRIPSEKRLIAHSLTSSANDGDFRNAIAKKIGVQPGGDPIILVVKKYKSVLKNLVDYVQEFGVKAPDGEKILRKMPLLLIDDEADHASVNTKEVLRDPDTREILADQDVTAINGLIRRLLKTFDQSVYVGYTATPFANIFIYPHQPDDDVNRWGEDLFPRSFIINLPPPSNYLGPVQVFGLEEYPDADLKAVPGLPIVRLVEDSEGLLPSAHNKDLMPQALPASLKDAIRAFLLTCAARAARGHGATHNSMLVHVTRFTAVQRIVHDLVAAELRSLQNRLRYGDGDRTPSLFDEMRAQWQEDFAPTCAVVSEQIEDPWMRPVTWDQVADCLVSASQRVETKIINGLASDVLDYYDRPEGLSVIAIGGDKLSRGLTLEGLSVSYYLRPSKMYDTLMQMGRWFGYRPGYTDLCRLYTTEELVSWYKHITVASEELRQEFDLMAQQGGTPKDYGLRVQTHPGGLLITAAGKMREGTKMRVSFDKTLAETTLFSTAEDVRRRNLAKTEDFVHSLGPTQNRDKGGYRWDGVSGSAVADFIEYLEAHPFSRMNPDKISGYIRKKIEPHAELTKWTVIVCSNESTHQRVSFAGLNVGLTLRSHDTKTVTDPQVYALIRRHLLSLGDEARDLSPSEYHAAMQNTMAAWQTKPKGRPEPKTPSGAMIRDARPQNRGLLLLYLLTPEEDETGTPYVGCGLSFPKTDYPHDALEYMVTRVYWDQEWED